MQCRMNVIIRVFLQFDIITGKILYTLGHDRQMSSGRRLPLVNSKLVFSTSSLRRVQSSARLSYSTTGMPFLENTIPFWVFV